MLTPKMIEKGPDRYWGFAETFARPTCTAPSKGELRLQFMRTRQHGRGSNLRSSLHLQVTDHPCHFLNLFEPEEERRMYLKATRQALDMDIEEQRDGTLLNVVYPECKRIELHDIDFFHGLMVLEGLAVKPQLIDHFRKESDDKRG